MLIFFRFPNGGMSVTIRGVSGKDLELLLVAVSVSPVTLLLDVDISEGCSACW